MKETRKFIKESTIYTIGEILTKSLAFILIPLYTRYFSKSEFGIYNLVITIWPILIIIFGKGFSSYLIRGYYNFESEESRKEFSGSIILFSLLLSIFLAFLIHVFGDDIFNLLLRDVDYRPYLQFAVGIAFLKLLINNILSLYRAKRKPVVVTSLSLFNFISTIGFILVFVVILRKGLFGALLGQTFGLLIVSLFLFFYVWKDIRFRLSRQYIFAGIIFVLPLIPHALSGWVINLSDRILIERFCSLEDLAIYSLGYQLAMSLDILINSMNQAWMPFFYSQADRPDGHKELKSSIIYYFTSVVIIGFGLSLFSHEIIYIAGKTEYLAAQKIFPLIIIAFVIHSIYYIAASSLFYKNKTGIIPIITVVAGILNIGLNIFLIPRYGYYAAAYSTIASFFIAALLSYFFSKKYFPLPFQFAKMGKIFFAASSLYLISYLFSDFNEIMKIGAKLVLFIIFPILLIAFNIIKRKDINKLFFRNNR